MEEVVVVPGAAKVANTSSETSTNLKAETTVKADASTKINVKTTMDATLEAGTDANTSTKVTDQAREEGGLGSANKASKGRNDSIRTHCRGEINKKKLLTREVANDFIKKTGKARDRRVREERRR